MKLDDITPLILTYNEEPNIRRCLERLTWASRIVVVDSGSTDATLAICCEFDIVEIVTRRFDDHTRQWNAGIDVADTEWILSFDADYIAPTALAEELQDLNAGERVAFFASFNYLLAGKKLRGTLYPDRAVLFSKVRCRYEADGHTQWLRIDGPTGILETTLAHDDRKSLSRWLDSQQKYSALEAEKLSGTAKPENLPDKLRKMIWPAAPAAFLYSLFAKRLILDGRPGLYYSLQRTYAELVLSLKLLERRLSSEIPPKPTKK